MKITRVVVDKDSRGFPQLLMLIQPTTDELQLLMELKAGPDFKALEVALEHGLELIRAMNACSRNQDFGGH